MINLHFEGTSIISLDIQSSYQISVIFIHLIIFFNYEKIVILKMNGV